jgi:lysozyme
MPQLNEYGLELIKSYERLRLTSYDDGYGYLTIGYGHTSDKFFEVKPNQTIDEPKAIELLRYDITEAEEIVIRQLLYKDELNDNQYSALVSIAFNSGSFKYRKNNGEIALTQLLVALNNKDYITAASVIRIHKVTSKGKAVLGLGRRRLCEYYLFTSYMTNDLQPKEWTKFVRSESERILLPT